MNATPEQLARQKINRQLTACGWVVQDYAAMDFGADRSARTETERFKCFDYEELVKRDKCLRWPIVITVPADSVQSDGLS